MHVLTKIFIVLVSLLAVLLVPLVVVYAHNENSYKSRLVAAEATAAAYASQVSVIEANAGAKQTRLETSIQELTNERTRLMSDKTAAEVSARQLESQVATANASQADIIARIANIEGVLSSGQQLTESLVAELRTLRADAVAIERQKVELDEALREVTSQLEVAEQARRALAEELARVKEERNTAVTKLGEAVNAGFGSRGNSRIVALGSIPDKNLTANVLKVERSSNEVLVEIDAGSRDGVKNDWSMTVGNGAKYIGTLRIIKVDINRSTGILTGEDKSGGKAEVGMIATAVAGMN